MTLTMNASSREDFRVALRSAGLTSLSDDILSKGVSIDLLVIAVPKYTLLTILFQSSLCHNP
jgi:hypothetical protein